MKTEFKFRKGLLWTLGLLMTVSIIWPSLSHGQEVVFEQDVEEQLEDQEDGPYNGFQVFNNLGYAVLLPINENDSMSTNYGDAFRLGNLYLWNLGKYFSTGFNIDLHYNGYNVEQDSAMNLYSQGFEHKKQKLNIYKLDFAPLVRVMYGKRGNSIGKYIDLGAYGAVTFGYSEFTRNKFDPKENHGAEIIEGRFTKLKYIERFEYGLQGQLGFNAFTIWGRYRASDLFKSNEGINNGNQLPDFPRVLVGIGISGWLN